MVEMTDARHRSISSALNAVKATEPCSRCCGREWAIAGESSIRLDASTVLPVVLVACRDCGFVTQHARGTLGLLTQQKRLR